MVFVLLGVAGRGGGGVGGGGEEGKNSDLVLVFVLLSVSRVHGAREDGGGALSDGDGDGVLVQSRQLLSLLPSQSRRSCTHSNGPVFTTVHNAVRYPAHIATDRT